MSEINDGGPAFPVTRDDVAQNDAWGGMSLRDYFAAKALNGLCASLSDETPRNLFLENAKREGIAPKERLALSAYEYADAMIRARGAE